MAKHEQGVIDAFNWHFFKKAAAEGKKVYPLALDGQDCYAGADYILSDSDRFALIEFKYTENEICSESKKNLRLSLCRQLLPNPRMSHLHDRCHFIAWRDSVSSQIKTNIYRLEVCNKGVFGPSCGLEDKTATTTKRTLADRFIDEFLSQRSTRSLSLQEFEEYLIWLLQKASKTTKTSLELLSYDEVAGICRTVIHNSIQDAYDWFQSKKPS